MPAVLASILREEKLYIFLKKSSWSEDEGIWRPCRGSILLDRHQDDCNALLKFALSAHKE